MPYIQTNDNGYITAKSLAAGNLEQAVEIDRETYNGIDLTAATSDAWPKYDPETGSVSDGSRQ